MRLRHVRTLLSALVAAVLVVPLTAGTARATTPDPVVFVHGFSGKSGQFSTMTRDFGANGYPEDRLHVFGYNSFQSNVTTAHQLADYIDNVLRRTGASKVDIVTHSMGGLSSRYYIKHLGGADRVDDWVSIGGPNNGTALAGFCDLLITACGEMRVGSNFLRDLNAGDPTPGNVTYTTFRSPCDLVINPVDSTILNGADNRRTACLGHIGMISDAGVINAVREVVS
ncbi:triacylglycerol lipase [Streptomyces calidiresistens]|uniref:Alpha/beta fold hydrolase n=1 Tax=Streptomyces calidiresistens TaxID=1485586 RepID=A0A7W3T0M3_9ACTN|nr:triacylglycerol lipase [Streptomyces calidiresistens]MBB0228673.1 alpha/beta fold hydrolase [Streptomyces calidiresistens]